MKKVIVKDWVAYTLLAINMLLIVFLAGDCEDLTFFIVSKIIGVIILVLNSIIIIKHSRLGDD